MERTLIFGECLLVFIKYLHEHEATQGKQVVRRQGKRHWFIGDMVDSLTLQSIFLFVNNFYFCILFLCVYGSYTM